MWAMVARRRLPWISADSPAELREFVNAYPQRMAKDAADTLAPADLADPALIAETRGALDELTGLLKLGSGFYPFQRV
jgi:succinylarginine dihydrolase